MPRHIPTPGAIVVLTAEDDRFAPARDRAAEMARERGVPVILYDRDAASLLENPLPTWWSSDGLERRVPDRLDEQELEAAGRHPIAAQVRELKASGIEAFGWLPSGNDAQALVDYVNGQGASAVVIPRDMAELEGLQALLAAGTTKPAEVLEERSVAEVVVA
jgi:hypothetical protein